MEKKYYILLLFTSVLLFLIGMIYGIEKNKNAANESIQNVDLTGGVYMRMVFVGSSSCIYSNNDETHKMVSFIKSELKNIMDVASIKFISTGTSFDVSSTSAFNYLNKSGPYDELLVGGGTSNLGIINYTSGSSAIPKVYLYIEEYESELHGLNIHNFRDAQKLIKTFTGQYEIQTLYENVKESSINDIFTFLELSDYLNNHSMNL